MAKPDAVTVFLTSKKREAYVRKCEAQRRPWRDPEFKKRMRQVVRNTPGNAAAMAKARSLSYTKTTRSAVSRKYWSDPEARELRSELARRKWKSKSFRRLVRRGKRNSEKYLASLAEIRKKCQTPAALEKRRKTMLAKWKAPDFRHHMLAARSRLV